MNGVCAFLSSVRDRTLNLGEAMKGVSWNGGSIRNVLSQVRTRTGARISRTFQTNTLNTARNEQFFVVFRGSNPAKSDHVLIGITKNGKSRLYDPQSGQRWANPKDFGNFTAWPLIFP